GVPKAASSGTIKAVPTAPAKPTPPREPIERLWLLSVAGEVRSAATTSEIAAMLRAGDLRPSDMVKPTRGGEFQQISEVDDFTDALVSLKGGSTSKPLTAQTRSGPPV